MSIKLLKESKNVIFAFLLCTAAITNYLNSLARHVTKNFTLFAWYVLLSNIHVPIFFFFFFFLQKVISFEKNQ